jgi:hypothetical protein
MNRQRGPRAAVLSVAAIALLSLAACGDDSSSTTTTTAASAALLPRNTVVPVSVVTQYFPDVTKEASTGPNETSVGKPIASRSVVFASADGKKKVTLSVDQYASASDAAAAYQTAVQGSKAAPGFKPAASPNLGLFRAQEAFCRREVPPERLSSGVLLDEDEFRIKSVVLDHGTPCLAFAFEEKLRVNVWSGRAQPASAWCRAVAQRSQASRAAGRARRECDCH